jgi:hypothetical protein
VRVGLKFAMIKGAEAKGFECTVDPTITGRYDGTFGSQATRVDSR